MTGPSWKEKRGDAVIDVKYYFMSHSFYILKKRIIIIAFLEKSREVQNLTKITRSLAIIVYFEENVVEK